MNHEDIQAYLNALPEVELWPELAAVFDRAGNAPRPDWELPLLACQAVGGNQADALPGAVAIACLQLSIILVDDMLDDDARGAHLDYGSGPSANMALAYQSAAILAVARTNLTDSQKVRANAVLAQAALATSAGQHLDVQNLQGEESYWQVVKAKSTPFYGAALKLGAILGSATIDVSNDLYSLGVIIGEIIQIEDDLQDALEVPANADWKERRNNLLLLYAQTADIEERERFIELAAMADDDNALVEAQRILINGGAVSYAAFQLVSRYRKAKELLSGIDLEDPSVLHHVLDEYADSLLSLLNQSNVAVSMESLLEQ